MNFKVAPLPSSFMLASIMGFFLSVFWIYPVVSEPWGATFAFFSIIVFVASMISAEKADPKLIEKLEKGQYKIIKK